ncbi:MAG: enoyl-CoA hydratase-related protein [Pseudomonadota bacterium]
MTRDYDTLQLEPVGPHVLIVRMNRPEAANALNTRMGEELLAVWSSFYVDQRDVRCIVLTGAGEKAFCAGGDLKERNGMTDAQWQAQHALFEQMSMALMDCPVPVIAAVNGAAYGGGCEMVAGVDFAYVARRARFALTEVTLGIMPGAMGTQNMPRAVGLRRAKEIILTGLPFSAEDAFAWGLANRVCDDDKLMDETLATAGRIAGNAPISTRQAKKSVTMAGQIDARNGYLFEIEAYNRMVTTEDRLEGVRAYNEKRKPDFKGR